MDRNLKVIFNGFFSTECQIKVVVMHYLFFCNKVNICIKTVVGEYL